MKNEPAFPQSVNARETGRGLTIRDYFAAKAMQGAMACNGIYDDEAKLAMWCYEQADAMIKVRGQ